MEACIYFMDEDGSDDEQQHESPRREPSQSADNPRDYIGSQNYEDFSPLVAGEPSGSAANGAVLTENYGEESPEHGEPTITFACADEIADRPATTANRAKSAAANHRVGRAKTGICAKNGFTRNSGANSAGCVGENAANGADDIFKLNIGGKSYRFRHEIILLSREPNSLLSILIKADHHKRLLFVDGYADSSGEYYLERNSRIAEHVIDYFLTGKLHKPHDICLERFREELLFWHLTNVELAPCCSILADPSRIDESIQIERELNQVSCFPEVRKVIWHIMENPSSSTLSKVFSFISISFIFTSVVGLIMGSMPEFQEDSRFAEFYHIDASRRNHQRGGGQIQHGQGLFFDALGNKYLLVERKNKSGKSNDTRMRIWLEDSGWDARFASPPPPPISFSRINDQRNLTADNFPIVGNLNETSGLTEFVYKSTDNPHHYLITLEYVCIAWFSVEFLIRFLVSPKKIRFLKRAMNLIDLFTVFPFFIELALSSLFGVNADKLKELTGAMIVIRILRVLRMARVFKLARYSMGLQVFGYTLKSSLRELCMLSMFLVTGTVFFSTIMYFLERDEPGTDFKSIPAACWWCIITVTTVGYGDCLITTTLGKSVAAVASIFGIIILAFPISMVVENFAFAQEQSHVENQIREAQMAVVANDYLMKRYPSRRKACRDPLENDESLRQRRADGEEHGGDFRRKSISAYQSIRHTTRRPTANY